MTKEHRDLYQEITDKIVSELEHGVVPWLKPWKTSGCSTALPRNFVSKRNYSGINILLLWATAQDRGYSSNEWLTFKQAKELGGSVRRGEKSTEIMYMEPRTKKVADESGQEHEEKWLFMRAWWVFNVQQCEGLKLEEANPALVSKEERDPHLTAFVKRLPLDLRHGGDRAYYAASNDYVQMPNYEAFDSPESYWATLFHETTHWTGHKDRCNRVFGKRFGDGEYAMEELVAELGSAFLCAEHNVEGEIRHASYINNWLEVFKKDKKAVFTAASAASKAAEWINSATAVAQMEAA